MISSGFQEALGKYVRDTGDRGFDIRAAHPVSGGDINGALCIEGNGTRYFVKYNRADRYPLMFEREAEGLDLLREHSDFCIPRVLGTGRWEDRSFLVLQWIEEGGRSGRFWEDFGQKLARMHSAGNDCFGGVNDNYMGSLSQSNEDRESWTDFFISQRLQPQLKLALDSGRVDSSLKAKFEGLFPRLGELIPEERPALVHGDLWSGNYMTGTNGEPWLIDPAVSYSHREVDIAMMHLFGGFPGEVFNAYNEVRPLEPGWQERIGIFNLYPLMVHVNLFGGGYLGQVDATLGKLV